MLDAYIIQKIKREQEAESAQRPIHVETPQDAPPRVPVTDDRKDDDDGERGVTIVDYSI